MNVFRPPRGGLALTCGITAFALLVLHEGGAWAQENAGKQAMDDIAGLYRLAVEHDARFGASLAKYEAVALNPSISRSRLLPQIMLTADRSRLAKEKTGGSVFRSVAGGDGRDEYSYNIDSHSLRISQSLFNREYYIQLRQSKSEFERAAVELEAARQDLILRLAEAYFKVLSAQAQVEFAHAEKDAVKRQLDQAQSRFEVGLDPITDVKKAEAAYDLAVADEILAVNGLDLSRSALYVIVNRDVSELRPLAEKIPVLRPDPDNIGAWVSTALDRNLELIIQRLTTNIAADEIKRRRSGHFPVLDLYANRNERDTRGGLPPTPGAGSRSACSCNCRCSRAAVCTTARNRRRIITTRRCRNLKRRTA